MGEKNDIFGQGMFVSINTVVAQYKISADIKSANFSMKHFCHDIEKMLRLFLQTWTFARLQIKNLSIAGRNLDEDYNFLAKILDKIL